VADVDTEGDALLYSKKGDAKVYADPVPTRDDIIIPLVTEEKNSQIYASGSERSLRCPNQPFGSRWRLTLKLRPRCSLTARTALSALGRRAYHRSRT